MQGVTDFQEKNTEIPKAHTVGAPLRMARVDINAAPSVAAALPSKTTAPEFFAPAKPYLNPGDVMAVLAVHGMGQQVPFATLDEVAMGLLKADARKNGRSEEEDQLAPLEARTVLIGDKKMQFLETTIQTEAGVRKVHLYEAYWAPKTEGVIGLAGTMKFLWHSGWSSLSQSKDGFVRWMFGGKVPFKAAQLESARSKLRLAVLTLVALILLDAIIGAAGAAALTGIGPGDWPQTYVLRDLTIIMAFPLAMAAAFWWAMGWPKRVFDRGQPDQAVKASQIGMTWFAALAVVICMAAVAAILVLGIDWLLGRGIIPRVTVFDRRFAATILPPVWVCLMLATRYIKNILVQTVGDVAIYISPHYLDAFAEKRHEIKETATSAASALYTALSDEESYQYAGVAFVGHSLGSVVAYDALNAVLNDDALRQGPMRAIDRTQGLVTFGSPLDRTAYIFGHQLDDERQTREMLAATVQPLIMDYKNRPFPWINVYSPADIVSSKLIFYDDAKQDLYQERQVKNREDKQALSPIKAHLEYWKTHAVWDSLHEVLSGPNRDREQRDRSVLLVTAA